METIEAILSRVSAPVLGEPGPDTQTLELLFRCAQRAPDHGVLRPWRFIVFRGAARDALGDLLAKAERESNPAAPDEALRKLRANPLRAPVVVACMAKIDTGHPKKVPRVEQVAAVAAGIQNIQLAAHARGYGAMWRTGPLASSPFLKTALGHSPDDEIVGFLYLGTPPDERRAKPVEDAGRFVRWWDEGGAG